MTCVCVCIYFGGVGTVVCGVCVFVCAVEKKPSVRICVDCFVSALSARQTSGAESFGGGCCPLHFIRQSWYEQSFGLRCPQTVWYLEYSPSRGSWWVTLTMMREQIPNGALDSALKFRKRMI